MLRLALRNIFRQKLRTAMTLAAIVSGVVGLILSGGFVADIFHQLGESIIHSQSGHIQIAREGYFSYGSRAPDKYLIEHAEGPSSVVAAFPQVEDVMLRVNFSGLLNNGRTDLAIIGEGVEADKEAQLGSHVHIMAGRQLAGPDNYGILLGEGVAQALKLAPGDRVTLVLNTAEGALNSLDFEIVGVFQTLSKDFDARAVRISLAAAQELLNHRGANTLVVSLKETRDTDRIATALRGQVGRGLEVKTWQELNDFYTKTIDLYDRQFGVLRLIILLMLLLSVANSVNMTVFERVGEFGTLMALGNRSGFVFRLTIIEYTLLGFFGGVLGVLVGIALALAISAVGIPMPPPPNANIGYTALIPVVPKEVGLAFTIGFVSTVCAALLPARRATRIPVVDALRQNI